MGANGDIDQTTNPTSALNPSTAIPQPTPLTAAFLTTGCLSSTLDLLSSASFVMGVALVPLDRAKDDF